MRKMMISYLPKPGKGRTFPGGWVGVPGDGGWIESDGTGVPGLNERKSRFRSHVWGSLRDSKAFWVTWTFSFPFLQLVYHGTSGKTRVAKARLPKIRLARREQTRL